MPRETVTGGKVLTGVLFTAGFLPLCLLGPPWLLYGVLQSAALLGVREFVRMAFDDRIPAEGWAGAATGALLPAVAFAAPTHLMPVVLLAPTPVLAVAVLRPRPVESAAHRITVALGTVFYVGLLFAATVLAGASDGRALLLLGAIAWLGDVGAYAAGSSLGRHKLAPAVSPNKTVEGAVGGLVGALVGATLARLIVLRDAAWADLFAVAVPCAVLSQVGDLAESLFKRSFGKKDSGTLLPGHGGILDRFDSLLLAAPGLLAYQALFGPILPT